MSDERYLDKFMDSLNETEFGLDNKLKGKILHKTYRKTKRGWVALRNIAAACLIVAGISSFIPSTPAYALREKLFSFIPGVGVVQNDEENGIIKSVLEKPVKVIDGNEFIEIKAAYVVDQTLQIMAKSNVGTADAGEFKNVKDFKEFFAGETAPSIYLVQGNKEVKPGFAARGGPSYETRIYSMEAGFPLDGDWIGKQSFQIKMEGFPQIVSITMSPVTSNSSPQSVGNAAVIDKVMVFANTARQDDIVEVLVSAVAPADYKDIRFQLYDWEKKAYIEQIHMVDNQGNVYDPDDRLKKQKDGSSNTFFFRIPQDRQDLELIIPQILYSRRYDKEDIQFNMPRKDKEILIHKEVQLGESRLLIEKASIVPANDPLLPKGFKAFDCLKIDASGKSINGSRERVTRIIPEIEVPDGIFGFVRPSSGTYADLWDSAAQSGFSLTEFENMDKTKRVRLNFTAECVMKGPWKLKLD